MESLSKKQQMFVLIVGCGALGSGLAARLAGHCHLSVADPDKRVIQSLQNSFKVDVFSNKGAAGKRVFDLVIYTTKLFDLRKAVNSTAQRLLPRNVLFLQNGLFDLSWVKRCFPVSILWRGVTTSAFRSIAAGLSVEDYRGDIYLGSFQGGRQKRSDVCSLLRQANFRTHMVRDYRCALWAKLVFSAVMNPLPVITAKGYSLLRRDHALAALVRQGVSEGKRVARAEGVRLSFYPVRIVNRVMCVECRRLVHKGSMYPDFIAGRSSELESITGAILGVARRYKIQTPVLEYIYRQAKRKFGSYA